MCKLTHGRLKSCAEIFFFFWYARIKSYWLKSCAESEGPSASQSLLSTWWLLRCWLSWNLLPFGSRMDFGLVNNNRSSSWFFEVLVSFDPPSMYGASACVFLCGWYKLSMLDNERATFGDWVKDEPSSSSQAIWALQT